jgi:hypothetical protein
MKHMALEILCSELIPEGVLRVCNRMAFRALFILILVYTNNIGSTLSKI